MAAKKKIKTSMSKNSGKRTLSFVDGTVTVTYRDPQASATAGAGFDLSVPQALDLADKLKEWAAQKAAEELAAKKAKP